MLVEILHMQKVYALIAAFFIFFSSAGEVVGGTICECPETAISQKSSASDLSLEQAPTAVFAAKEIPSQDQNVVFHDCHFGHCGFILNFHPTLSSPVGHLKAAVFGPYAFFPSGFRSETLRPPSHV